jgi:type VI secretion system secreted protein Hcp
MMKSVRWMACLLAAAGLAVSTPRDAAAQLYMNYNDHAAKGDVTASAHEGWIELTSVQWPTGAAPRSGGPGSVVITKRPDRASPNLMKACTSGQTVRQVELSMPERSRTGAATNRRIVLSNVRLSNCQAAGEDYPTESLSLNYTKLDFDPGTGAAAAGYLKLGDIRGEATDSRFRDWIPLESIEFDRAAAARGAVPIRLTRRSDRSSPALRTAHSRQTRFAEAILAVRDDRDPARYMTIRMKDVLVSSYQTGGGADGLTLQAIVEISGL